MWQSARVQERQMESANEHPTSPVGLQGFSMAICQLQEGLLSKPHIKEIDLSESRRRVELEALALESALNRQTPRSFLS